MAGVVTSCNFHAMLYPRSTSSLLLALSSQWAKRITSTSPKIATCVTLPHNSNDGSRLDMKPTYIVDTDAGPDDVMALAYLLANDNIEIEAITISYGLAHAMDGAATVAKVAALAGKDEIPVYVGQTEPLRGDATFPATWRSLSDALPGVDLPTNFREHEMEPAAHFLQRRMCITERPVRVLALGSLTNLASLHECEHSALEGLKEIVMMGGAFEVAGNAAPVNRDAEWNILVDPLAAMRVFNLGRPMLVVPLDATRQVPIDASFIDEFHVIGGQTPLGRLTGQVLDTIRHIAEAGAYYAWDPLAAVVLLHRNVVRTVDHAVNVIQDPAESGTTRRAENGHVVSVAYEVEAPRFRQLFMEAFKRR